ncbi:DUF2059 domain-containing protein [Uliginosibacterium sp. H3]|uniref:DUF2059 domain-containing protein n=1 Tax=Uliginosibacterium silvisoli TaxID=3114758 RepID=A0ABU6JZV2_9RHOO|nr:DUF2059 domain-containing protein [Uliginosibacterium sp. H3]
MPRTAKTSRPLRPALLATLLAALLLNLAPAHADELTAEKKADILKLLSANGTERVVDSLSTMVTQSYMQSLRNCTNCSPKIPDVVRNETRSVLASHMRGDGGLLDRQVPIYSAHFTHAEVKQLLAFYNTAVGKKLVSQSGDVTRGSIQASQEWLNGLAPEIRERVDVALTKGGIKPPQPGTPPPSVMQPPAQQSGR